MIQKLELNLWKISIGNPIYKAFPDQPKEWNESSVDQLLKTEILLGIFVAIFIFFKSIAGQIIYWTFLISDRYFRNRPISNCTDIKLTKNQKFFQKTGTFEFNRDEFQICLLTCYWHWTKLIVKPDFSENYYFSVELHVSFLWYKRKNWEISEYIEEFFYFSKILGFFRVQF